MTNAAFNEQFRKRTKEFAVRALAFISAVPFHTATKIMAYQFGKSATSAGANFRAFCRGRSKAEKYAKICIGVEEADECIYWIELFEATGYGNSIEFDWFSSAALEILKVSATIKSSLSS